MRSDARRNQEQILKTARELFLQRGTHVPMEEIAAESGVGVGTLYRRFPDRIALVKAVAMRNMDRLRHEVDAAMAEEPDGWHCFARMIQRIYELRLGDPVPLLLPPLVEQARDDQEFQGARRATARAVATVLDRAKAEQAIRPGLTVADVLTLATARPEPSALLGEQAAERLSARYLQIVLDGLRADSAFQAPPVDDAEVETYLA